MTMLRGTIVCLLVGLLGLAAPVTAQDEVQIKTLPLRDGIYMLEGKGGNIGLIYDGLD